MPGIPWLLVHHTELAEDYAVIRSWPLCASHSPAPARRQTSGAFPIRRGSARELRRVELVVVPQAERLAPERIEAGCQREAVGRVLGQRFLNSSKDNDCLAMAITRNY